MTTPRTQSLQLIERYYAAFNKSDSIGMLDCLSEYIAHDVNQGSRRNGKAAFKEFLAHMDRCYQEQLEKIVIMASEDGTRAAAEFIVQGTYKATDSDLPPATGQTYTLPAGTFFDITEGKITRVTTYYNLQDWLAQISKAA
jgi:steroid delta-isomerase-like uncharacterized protein